MARDAGTLILNKAAVIADFTSSWFELPYVGQGVKSMLAVQLLYTGGVGTLDSIIYLEGTVDSTVADLVTILDSATIGAATSITETLKSPLLFMDTDLAIQKFRIRFAITNLTSLAVLKAYQMPSVPANQVA